MHTQQQDDGADGVTTITYEEEDGVQGRARSSCEPSNGQSLSLSRISHADDSVSHSDSFASSFGGGSERMGDRTPPHALRRY